MNFEGIGSRERQIHFTNFTSIWDADITSARVLDLARELTVVADKLSKVGKADESADDERRSLLAHLKSIVKRRRLRHQFISAELFADPAWDMILDLTIARFNEAPVAVSSLCIAANVPATTALRWISRLLDDGVVYRTMDPDDRRRSFICLSDQMYSKMIAFAKATRPSS